MKKLRNVHWRRGFRRQGACRPPHTTLPARVGRAARYKEVGERCRDCQERELPHQPTYLCNDAAYARSGHIHRIQAARTYQRQDHPDICQNRQQEERRCRKSGG